MESNCARSFENKIVVSISSAAASDLNCLKNAITFVITFQ